MHLSCTKYDVFFIKRWAQITFYNLYNIQKKTQKYAEKKYPKIYYHKLTTKITTLAFHKLTKSFSFVSCDNISECCVISSNCLTTRKQDELSPQYDCRHEYPTLI